MSESPVANQKETCIFISMEHGRVDVPLSFGDLVRGMLPPEAGDNIVHEIAAKCCERCGQPSGCECVDDVIASTSWLTSWTGEEFNVMTDIITEAQRSFRIRRVPHA